MDAIVLSNTIILVDSGIVIERDPEQINRVTLHVPGLPAPHVFEGSDAVELWHYFDKGDWRGE